MIESCSLKIWFQFLQIRNRPEYGCKIGFHVAQYRMFVLSNAGPMKLTFVWQLHQIVDGCFPIEVFRYHQSLLQRQNCVIIVVTSQTQMPVEINILGIPIILKLLLHPELFIFLNFLEILGWCGCPVVVSAGIDPTAFKTIALFRIWVRFFIRFCVQIRFSFYAVGRFAIFFWVSVLLRCLIFGFWCWRHMLILTIKIIIIFENKKIEF